MRNIKQRTHEIKIRLTDEELQKLNANVARSGWNREQYIRFVLEGAIIKEAPPVEYYEMIIKLRNVGSNLNQLFKLASAAGLLYTDELREALDENRKIEKELWQAVTVEKPNKRL